MSIIVLTPPPKTNAALATTDGSNESFGSRLASDFLHLVGLEGRHFDSFEQLRDFAQAQIDAAAPQEVVAEVAAPAVEAPVMESAPIVAPPADASAAVNGVSG